MSAKGRAGKEAWVARAATFDRDLTDQIMADATVRMGSWEAKGRIPLRVRVIARLAGRPVRLPERQAGR